MNEHDQKLLDEGFEYACLTGEVPSMMPKRVELSARAVLVCRQDDDFFAVDEVCPHKQRSMASGIVFGGEIICPWHSYAFDLQTGRCNQRRCAPATLYEVALVDDRVYVRV